MYVYCIVFRIYFIKMEQKSIHHSFFLLASDIYEISYKKKQDKIGMALLVIVECFTPYKSVM